MPSYNKKNNAGVGKRILDTSGDIFANILTGAGKSLEGIMDLGAGLAGALVGIFDKEKQARIKKFIERDYTADLYGNKLQELTATSYLNDNKAGHIAEQIFNGVGQMLPSIIAGGAAGMIGKGLGATSKVLGAAKNAASLTALGLGAAGNGTEEAFNDGADYGKGLLYGAANGAVEVGTEKLFGGPTKQLFGKGVLDGMERVAATGAKRVVKNALEEGAEEVISETVNPALKSIYKGKDAFNEYKDADYWKGVAEAGIVGAGTSLVYGGASNVGKNVGRKITGKTDFGGYVGKEIDIAESKDVIDELEKKRDDIWADENISPEDKETLNREIDTYVSKNNENISKILKKSSESRRESLVEKFGLSEDFDEQGNYRGLQSNAKISSEYASPSMKAADVERDLNAINEKLKKENSEPISLFDGDLTEGAKENYTKCKKVINALNKVAGTPLGFAVVNGQNSVNGIIREGKRIYIAADNFSSDAWMQSVVHEYDHFAEGTKEYGELWKLLSSDEALFEQATSELKKRGYDTENIIENVREGGAIMAEITFGNEAFIDKLIRSNSTLAGKVLNKIISVKEAIRSFSSSAARAEYQRLHKSEKLYLKAIERAGGRYSGGKIILPRKEDDDNVDESAQEEYNNIDDTARFAKKRTPYVQWQSDALAWANNPKTKVGDINRGYDENYVYVYKAIDPYDEGKATDYSIVSRSRIDVEKDLIEYVKRRNERNNNNLHASIASHRNGRKGRNRDSSNIAEQSGGNGRSSGLYRGESEGRTKRHTETGVKGSEIANDSVPEDTSTDDDTKFSRTPYVQWKSDALAWANNPKTKVGDINDGYDEKYHYYYEATDPYDEGKATDYRVLKRISIAAEQQAYENDEYRNKRRYERKNSALYENLNEYRAGEGNSNRDGSTIEEQPGRNGRGSGLYRGESDSKQERHTETSVKGSEVETDSVPEDTSTDGDDTRFSRKRYQNIDEGTRNYANANLQKVYSKEESRKIIENAAACIQLDESSYINLPGKNLIVEQLYRELNSKPEGERYKGALQIADQIINNAVTESIWDDGADTQAVEMLSILKQYLHSFDLDPIKAEIKSRYGSVNRAYLLWGARKGQKGTGADVIGEMLESDGIFVHGINPADIFFEIDDMYTKAKNTLKSKKKELLKQSLSAEEYEKLRSEIANEILRGYDYTGEQSSLAKAEEKYKKIIEALRKRLNDARAVNAEENKVIDSIKRLRDLKKGEFFNATQFNPDIFKGSIEKLCRIVYRGDINKSGMTDILKGLRDWYSKDNPMLNKIEPTKDMSGLDRSAYNEEIAALIDSLINKDGKFGSEEYKRLSAIVGYFTKFIESHNKVYRNGKLVEALPIAQRYIDTVQENKQIHTFVVDKLFSSRYSQTFGDTASVIRNIDKYARGFFTETFEELREGEINAALLEMDIFKPIEEFLKENKKYTKESDGATVKYMGEEISKNMALSLYMTLKREHALSGLAYSGFKFVEGGKERRFSGFLKGISEEEQKSITKAELKAKGEEVANQLYAQFNDTDKQLIKLIEGALNKDCKNAKYDTDMKRQGYSNVVGDYYYPIRRADIAKNIDDGFINELNSVSNASFNKETVKGAKSTLLIESVFDVVPRHIKAVSLYAGLATAIDNYNILFNLNILDNPNTPISLRTETKEILLRKTDKGGEHPSDKFLRKLLADIQGISPETKGIWSVALGHIRGGYAKFQLGVNVKVLFSQLTSYIAASGKLDYSSLVRGFGVRGKDVDVYCRLAELRNHDSAAAKAQGVLDTIGTVGDIFMKPIGLVDRFVIQRLFGACQVQAEKNGEGAIGTEENKKAAGKLLTDVILETQQNALATERSAAMRSGNEIMKTLTMFTADSMKVIGRVMDGIGEISAIKSRIKKGGGNITELQAQLKQAKKRATKSICALVISAIYMACVAELFRWLLAKDKDDENVLEIMTLDAIGNLFGGLPLIKDLYAKLVDGYDLNNYAYSTINDLFDSVSGIKDAAEKIIGGKENKQDITSLVKRMIYATGQLFGVPVRNMYNLTTGLTKRISPSAGYKIDAFFYNKNYRSDLKKALEEEDEKKVATIAGLILNEDIGEIKDKNVREEIRTLMTGGYDVMPHTVGNSISFNGEKIEIKRKDRRYIESMYGQANDELSKLFKTPRYKSASDTVKAKAIKRTYRIYYDMAVAELAGTDSAAKNVLFAEAFDIAQLAFILSAINNLSEQEGASDSRKSRIMHYLNTLNLTAAQKYMIMGYIGYKNNEGEEKVKSYISSLNLTTAQQKALFAYSGY